MSKEQSNECLANYNPLVFPLNKPPYEYTMREAKQYFNWYMEHLDERCEYLRQTVSSQLPINIESLDFSFQSLVPLWRWFLSVAEVTTWENPILDEIRNNSSLSDDKRRFFLDVHSSNNRHLSTFTEYVIRDIGMYVGKVFTIAYPNHITWSFIHKPKNHIHVNQPGLIGFLLTKEDFLNHVPAAPDYLFEPIHMTQVQAQKLTRNASSEMDLYNICMIWQPKYNPT